MLPGALVLLCHASCSHTRWLGPAGWNARTPLASIGPPAALNVPAQWALQDVSSASVRPPRTDQVVDPAVCSMGPPIAPFSPDAGVSSDLHIGWVALCWLSFRSLKFISPVGAHLAPGLTSVWLADAVVKDFITSPPPLMPGLNHDVDLLDSCPDPMELSGEPQDFSAIPAASSRNVNIFGGRPCRSCPPASPVLTADTQRGGATCLAWQRKVAQRP